jgi:serine phosphatase RsbU (regulator of sigma subunit)
MSNELNFAGAFLTLYVLRRGLLEDLKGDKFTVGGPQEEAFRIYTNHRLVLQGNEQFIMLTDGLQNQLGAENDKRFSSKRVRETLEDMANLPFEEQKAFLEQTIDNWKGNSAQTDDLLVLSFKVDAQA